MFALIFTALATVVPQPAPGAGQICLARPYNFAGSLIHWRAYTSEGDYIGELRNAKVLCFDRDPGAHSIEVHIKALVTDGGPFALERSLANGKKRFARAAKVRVANGARLVLRVRFTNQEVSFERKSNEWLKKKRMRPTPPQQLSREERGRREIRGG